MRYRDPDGKQLKKTFRLKRSAVAFGNRVETDKQRGEWIDPEAGRVTFEDYAREWVELQTFNPRLAVENRLGVHVYPLIGGKHLRNIKPSTMQAWLWSVEDLSGVRTNRGSRQWTAGSDVVILQERPALTWPDTAANCPDVTLMSQPFSGRGC